MPGARLIISMRLIFLANALKAATPSEIRGRVPGIPFCERGYNHSMEEDSPQLTDPTPQMDDHVDTALRPSTLASLIGQEQVKQNLEILIAAARRRNEPLDHVLFYGPPGLGKTTLAHVLANEMGVNIKITAGPAIERTGDLAAILTNLRAGDILFIDEIHRLGKAIEEVLYPAMEDYALDIVIGKGPAARSIRLKLPHFTVIGATTRLALISSPLRARLGQFTAWIITIQNR